MRLWMAAAALAVAACATQPSTPQSPASGAATTKAAAVLELDNAADRTRVTLKRGDELKVMLDAQALAGLQWRLPKDFTPVLSQIGERIFLSKGLDPRNLGGGGINVFRYRAERSGKVTLTFDYGPFDLNAPTTRSVRYEVTVE